LDSLFWLWARADRALDLGLLELVVGPLDFRHQDQQNHHRDEDGAGAADHSGTRAKAITATSVTAATHSIA
jgi:hypothetical protein